MSAAVDFGASELDGKYRYLVQGYESDPNYSRFKCVIRFRTRAGDV